MSAQLQRPAVRKLVFNLSRRGVLRSRLRSSRLRIRVAALGRGLVSRGHAAACSVTFRPFFLST